MTHLLSRTRLAVLAGAIALVAPAVRADIPPFPSQERIPFPPQERAVAGLDFETRYDPASHTDRRIVELVDCATGHRNCGIAKTAGVMEAEVLRVNGAAISSLEEVRAPFLNTPPSKTVSIIFQRRGADGAAKGPPLTVRFSGR